MDKQFKLEFGKTYYQYLNKTTRHDAGYRQLIFGSFDEGCLRYLFHSPVTRQTVMLTSNQVSQLSIENPWERR